jgi:hypothetical protein
MNLSLGYLLSSYKNVILPPLALNLQLAVQYLWAASVLAQLFVCGVLVFRRHYRRLPFFTTYIVLNLCQAAFLKVVYLRFGDNSYEAFAAAWWSEGITLAARLCATAEVLHLVIQAYRGIWGLAWRLLAVTSLFVTIGVVAFSAGDRYWALIEADRGYHLVFATALIACLLMIQHYRIFVDSVYKSLLVGFCLYSCLKILINAATPTLMYLHYANFKTIWQFATLLPYPILLAFFALVLARPLPAIREQHATLNRKLINFWKIEEPHS